MEAPTASLSTAGAADAAGTFVAQLEAWIREQRATGLISRDVVETLAAEVRADDAYWQGLKPRFDDAWERVEAHLRKEDRPLREILTDPITAKAVEAAGSVDADVEAVGTFLRSPAVEAMLGDLLYMGITEFVRRVDLIGAVIDKLPVLGSIRKKIVATFAEEFERRLEGQVKGFLGGFSGMAVERTMQFIFREENRPAFRAAQRQLMEHILDRPLNTLLPDAERTGWLRDSVWGSLREPALRDESEILDLIFDIAGEEPLADWMWPLSQTARGVGARGLAGFWDSERGRGLKP